jgi:hypothetical protein
VTPEPDHLFARPLLTHWRKSCAGAKIVYSRAEHVFIPKHYFASKLFAAVREAFSNAYPDKKVPNKTAIHRLVRIFRETGSICDRKHVRRRTVLANTTALLQEYSGECAVGRGLWPPRCPNFTPPDFFLCGFLKERVYSNNPGNLEELKHNIEQPVANTDPETLRKVTRNTLKRVDTCLREGGENFQHLL